MTLGPTADPETRREPNPAALSAVSDQAFVTLATNDVYCQGALVLGQSLREHRATRRLVVLVTPRVSNPLRYARLTHTPGSSDRGAGGGSRPWSVSLDQRTRGALDTCGGPCGRY